jgi:hypothetical protein
VRIRAKTYALMRVEHLGLQVAFGAFRPKPQSICYPRRRDVPFGVTYRHLIALPRERFCVLEKQARDIQPRRFAAISRTAFGVLRPKPHPSDEPAAALECPSTSDWSKFDAFAAPCTYAWTIDAQKLPSAPEWQPCSAIEGIPAGACKRLQRHRRLKTFYVGAQSAKEMQIGFVESCASDQIVLADIDGPTRFAIRRAETTQYPTTCQMKLLAVDLGQWLAAFGGHEMPAEFNTSGYSATGAFLGGPIGSAPTMLFSEASEPFHVATSQGTILPDGWSANGKRRQWNGKPFEKPPRLGLLRLTKRLLLDEKKGFYRQTQAEHLDPKLLLATPPEHSFVGAQMRDKQIVWQEQSRKTCTLLTGEIDGQELLTHPRRLPKFPARARSSPSAAMRCSSATTRTYRCYRS